MLTYSGRRPKLDGDGKPVTRWDGVGVLKNSATGREVPDPQALVQGLLGDAVRAAVPPAGEGSGRVAQASATTVAR